MGCFGCCKDDYMQKAADNGPYMTSHSSGEVYTGLVFSCYKLPISILKWYKKISLDSIGLLLFSLLVDTLL